MLANFINDAFTVIEDVAKPAFNDIIKDIDQVIEKISYQDADPMAPAGFAAGYLFELTGQDYHDYINECYTTNSDLSDDLQ